MTAGAGAEPAGHGSDLARRAVAELVGSALLVAAVIGSGIEAQRLSPHDFGLRLLENTVATAAALVAVIFAVGPVSGAHLNPVISLADRFFGGLTSRQLGTYVVAQFAGGTLGALAANLMFSLPAVTLSHHARATGAHLFAEVIATSGLVLVVFGVVRSGRAAAAPVAVGAYIAAAYWFTSSTSFANPAVTFSRMLSDSFAGIAPGSVPGFVGAEIVGGVLGTALVAVLYPRIRAVAGAVVVPHEEAR